MVAELVVAFTDPGSFWYSGAAVSLLLDEGICSVVGHQQDQLMYQQEVIDEAGAARTPFHQYAQEYKGKPVDLRIGNEPETLAVDEKLCAELADVEANPLGELSLLGMNDAREKRIKQLAFMLMVHARNRAIQMITRLIDPVNGLEIWRRSLSDVDSHGKQNVKPWRSVNVLYGSTRHRTWTRSGTQSKQQYWHATHWFQSGADASD